MKTRLLAATASLGAVALVGAAGIAGVMVPTGEALADRVEVVQAVGAGHPQAALAVIDIDGRAWADLAPGQGRIVAFFRPRELFMVDGDPGDGDD